MLIGICGNLGSDKDTFGDWLVGHRDVVRTMSFARAVKRITTDLFGVDVKLKNSRTRKLMQDVGSKMREIDPNVWINIVWRDYMKSYHPNNIVITDVRHINEAEMILKNGRLIVLECPEELRKERISIRDFNGEPINEADWKAWHEHESETAISDIKQLYSKEPKTLVINQTTNDLEENRRLLYQKLITFLQ